MAQRLPTDRASYLRLATPPDKAVLRLVVGLVVATIGFFVVTLIALLAVDGVVRMSGGTLEIDTGRISPTLLLATNLGLGLCIPLAGLLLLGIYSLHPRWLCSIGPGLRWRWLGTCATIAGVVWGVLFVLILLGAATEDKSRLDGTVIAFIAVVLVTTPLQAAGEEFLFRGFLLQSLGATRLPAWACWVLSGALFATAHGQFAPPLFADRWLIGVVFAWLATETGGLEASIALHAAKNISVLIPAAILGELSGAIDPTNVTWLPVALDTVMLSIAGFWIRKRYGRKVGRPPSQDIFPAGSQAG